MRLYADEAGIQKADSHCAIAGYFGRLADWDAFGAGWNAVLDHHDVAEFHSKFFFAPRKDGQPTGKYMSRKQPSEERYYSDWSDEDKRQFLNDLLTAETSAHIWPMGAIVDREAFQGLTYGEQKYLTGAHYVRDKHGNYRWGPGSTGAASKPYFMAYQYVLVSMNDYLRPGEQALYVLGRQDEYKALAHMQFTIAKLRADPTITAGFGDVIFQDAIDAPGLQLADLLVHCAWVSASGRQLGPLRTRALDSLEQKMGTAHLLGLTLGARPGPVLYDAERFERMLSLPPLTPEARVWIREQGPQGRTDERNARRATGPGTLRRRGETPARRSPLGDRATREGVPGEVAPEPAQAWTKAQEAERRGFGPRR